MNNFISALEGQYGPAMVIGLLLTMAVLLGILFGASLVALLASLRKRQWLEANQADHNALQSLLAEARAQSARIKTEQETAEIELELQQTQAHEALARHDALVSRTQLQDDRIIKLQAELEAAESLSRARQRELLSRRDFGGDNELPTLIKRVSGGNKISPSLIDSGIIPDDQIIPTLPEAELTANVEAYDLSDLEDLVISKA